MAEADCVIVGGGIGGAVLARALAARGRRVLICERDKTVPPNARPEVLAHSTLATFDALGMGRIREEAALPVAGLRLHRAGGAVLFEIGSDDIRLAGAQPYSTEPNRVRRLLLEPVSGVEVWRGVEVRGLLRDGGRVAGIEAVRDGRPVAVRAPLVVGDDGGPSRIRQALGIPLRFTTFPVEFIIPRGEPPAWSGEPVGEAWIDPPGLRAGLFAALRLPLPGSRAALVLGMSHAAWARLQADAASFRRELERLSPPCASLIAGRAFPEEFAAVQRPFGHAARYVSDGAAILGDAAHPVTPVGGQGANMSVADAVALAEVADEALRAGDCSARRLSAYEDIRRPANHRSLHFSVRATQVLRLLSAFPWLAGLVPWQLARFNRNPDVKERFIRAVAQAFRDEPLEVSRT
jgi:2-polyprenyl-6-methoxyphenol hydroxylase-like FAD-dependent oxidoreductase